MTERISVGLLRSGAAKKYRPKLGRALTSPAVSVGRRLVVGAASLEAVQACVSACQTAGDIVLLVPEKHRGAFPDLAMRGFSGMLSCQPEWIEWLRDIAPDATAIALGEDYFHDNVVRLVTAYSALS